MLETDLKGSKVSGILLEPEASAGGSLGPRGRRAINLLGIPSGEKQWDLGSPWEGQRREKVSGRRLGRGRNRILYGTLKRKIKDLELESGPS